MYLFRFVAFLVLAVTTSFINAQDSTVSKSKYLPSVGGGVGILSFLGDVGSNSSLSALSNTRIAYNFTIEQRFNSLIGIQANGLYGSLAKNERGSTSNLNFESPLMGGELSLNIYCDNDLFSNRNLAFAPYFGGGAGYYNFDPHGDLFDANGNEYFYWSDGSIKDMEELDENLGTANIISRDYKYETQLTDASNYDRSTLVFPIQAGLRFKMSHSLSANVSATYYITQTDFIDNLKANDDNDAFVSGKFTLLFHIGGSSMKDEGIYSEIDFSEIDKEDSDEDGVKNENDDCPLSKKGVEVDGNGCPIDSDKDGVPDYLDKEANSEKNAIVDGEGKTITEEQLLKLYSDSLATDRDRIREEYPSMYGIFVTDQSFPDESMLGDEFSKPSESNENNENSSNSEVASNNASNPNSKIPIKFQSADFNNDGVITPDEIYKVIDGFFEGSNNFDIDSIHGLIDYFFDQE